jgi:hypothetical protein
MVQHGALVTQHNSRMRIYVEHVACAVELKAYCEHSNEPSDAKNAEIFLEVEDQRNVSCGHRNELSDFLKYGDFLISLGPRTRRADTSLSVNFVRGFHGFTSSCFPPNCD